MTSEIDLTDWVEAEKDLKVFKFKAWPFATKNTLNDAAFEGMREMKKIVERKMVLRNKFTKKSIQFRKTTTLLVRKQESSFGSTADYMILQEDGGTDRGKSGKAVAIPTSYAAGQPGSQPRTKLPKKAHKMRNIRLTKARTRGTSRKQRNFLLVQDAKARNIKYIFMDLGRRKGVFRVLGSKKNIKLKMVADVSHKSVRIPPTPTLKPAFKKVSKELDEIYKRKLIQQLRRHNIWK